MALTFERNCEVHGTSVFIAVVQSHPRDRNFGSSKGVTVFFCSLHLRPIQKCHNFLGLMVTASVLHYILNTIHLTIDVRNVCVFFAPLFSSFTTIVTYLLTKELKVNAPDVCTFRKGNRLHMQIGLGGSA